MVFEMGSLHQMKCAYSHLELVLKIRKIPSVSLKRLGVVHVNIVCAHKKGIQPKAKHCFLSFHTLACLHFFFLISYGLLCAITLLRKRREEETTTLHLAVRLNQRDTMRMKLFSRNEMK